MPLNRVIGYIKKTTHCVLVLFGVMVITAFVLAFTNIPYRAYYLLGTKNTKIQTTPEFIVQMSGSGFPSTDALLRTFYTAKAARQFPSAKIVLAIPAIAHDSSNLILFRNELETRQISAARIYFESLGINTYSQVSNIAHDKIQNHQDALLIITSPEHMYRTLKTFRKAGFENVGGLPAFENNLQKESLRNNKYYNIPQQNLDLRYNFWNYLKLEITVAREYMAIAYYKLMGWI